MNKLGLRQKFGKEDAGEALQAAEAVVKSERALGQVILSAGYNGEIKVRPHVLLLVRHCCVRAPCIQPLASILFSGDVYSLHAVGRRQLPS